MQVLRGVDVEVEQATQRQVHGDDLVEVDLLVDAAQLDEIGLAQRHRRRRTEHRPVVTVETEEPVRHGCGPYARGVPTTESTRRTRKQLGAWCTPDDLVDLVVERTIDDTFAVAGAGDRPVRVLDPACGDGRFLAAAARRLHALGRRATLTGVDLDPGAIASADVPGAELILADALAFDWGGRQFDVVLGNPPFLSQLCASTTRGGASRHGGGPYADAAAEFLALAIRLAEPGDGRVGLVLPQSILASRDAGPVRADATAAASMCWSWWSPNHVFDAQVLVCALGFRIDRAARAGAVSTPVGSDATWSHVVTGELGIPQLPALATDGTVGDRARCSLNFRDEYYGLIPAVSDSGSGPPLVTSGLIDPGRCHWGERPVRFAKREFSAPRVDVGRLDARMRAWAATQAGPQGARRQPDANRRGGRRSVRRVVAGRARQLGGAGRPTPPCGKLAAVLTSPVAAAAAWHAAAGTGLSARAIRLGPAALASLPWPAGDLGPAAQLLRDGDVLGCGRAVAAAYACGTTAPDDALFEWWSAIRQRRSGCPWRVVNRSQPGEPAIIHSSTSPTNSLRCTASASGVLTSSVTSNTALSSVVATRATANGSIPNARCGRHAAYAMPSDKAKPNAPRCRAMCVVAPVASPNTSGCTLCAAITTATHASAGRSQPPRPSRGGRARSSTRAVRSGSGSTPRSRTVRVSAETRSAYARQSGHPSRWSSSSRSWAAGSSSSTAAEISSRADVHSTIIHGRSGVGTRFPPIDRAMPIDCHRWIT